MMRPDETDAARAQHAHRQLPRRAGTGATRRRRVGRSAGSRRLGAPSYELVDGQIVVAPTAERARRHPAGGHAHGRTAMRARTWPSATPSQFAALVEVPPGAGTIVAAAFDFEGTGEFADAVPFDNEATSYTSTTFTATHEFSTPGTYFPVLRVVSHRQGEPDNPFGRIENLGRVPRGGGVATSRRALLPVAELSFLAVAFGLLDA